MTVLSKLARHPGTTRTAARGGGVVVQHTTAAISGSAGFRCGASAAKSRVSLMGSNCGPDNQFSDQNHHLQNVFQQQEVQIRLFCSALRTATKELAAVLQAPDDVVLLDKMSTEEASAAKDPASEINTSISIEGGPTASSPEAGEVSPPEAGEVAQQTKMFLDDVEGSSKSSYRDA